MADAENEPAAPDGAVENQPENTEEEDSKPEPAVTDDVEQGETQVEEKPASPEAKDSEKHVEEPPTEVSEDKPAADESEEATKPDEDGEAKQEEEGEAEKTEEGDEKPEGEEAPVSAEANAESSEVAETNEGQPEGGDGADGVTEDAGGAETAAGDTVEGEVEGEVAESSPSKEGEEGPEATEPPTGDEADGEAKEGGEGEPESEAITEDGEKKTDEEAEKLDEENKAEEPVAEEGDREGSPVGEKLSREPTPDAIKAVEIEHERLEATTPDKIDEEGEGEYELREEDEERMEEDDEEEDEDVEPAFRREELIEKYHEALADREQLQQHNYALQHRLAEYFRKKKADERQDYDKNVTDQEQRYLKYMAQLEDLRRQDMMEKDNFRAQIEDAKERCQDKKEKVDFERKKFMEFKKQVALNSVNSRSGKPIPPKDIEQYLVNEVKKEQEVVNVRLENIKLKNKLKKKDQQLKSKEELAEGLHLIDFEQLKIENQTYNEKIEERNEELLKLRKKITSTVQVLTHLKEKLQFVQGENLEQSQTLKNVEASLAQARDVLSRTKQARDALRIDNQRLRQNCGLLGNEPLLRDFEERKDEGDDLRSKLEELRMRHAELTLHCNQVRRKIEQARQTVT